MSLIRREGLPKHLEKVLEVKGEYKDFGIVVGTPVTAVMRPEKDYVRIYHKEHDIPELEYFVEIGVGKLIYNNYKPSTDNQNVSIESLNHRWGWYGCEIADLEGLADAANKLLQELRESPDYPHKPLMAAQIS